MSDFARHASRPTILIVDDEPENLTVLGELLQPAYRVQAARSGEQALQIVKQQPPDLILLDVMMPGMDGYAVLSRLREDEHTRDMPVIFVTALSDEAHEQRGLDLGAVDYLVKPLRPAIVLARVRNQLALKQAADLLREHGEALERTLREMQAFSHTVSHDLRAPLRVINGFAQILKETEAGKWSEEARDYLDRIIASSVKMAQMMDDILSYSRGERAGMEIALLDLNALVAEVVQEQGEGFPNAKITVAPLPSVKANPTMLRQVFGNLVGNALKFSAKSPAQKVEIGTCDGVAGTEIFVRDNGVCFDMAHANKLFAIFQRLPGHHEIAGSGVGLSIVKRLIERHGGRIRAEAAPGAGATFSFTLGDNC